MKLRRHLRPEAICLDLETRRIPEGEDAGDFDPESPRNLERIREQTLEELTALLDRTGEVPNVRRLFREFHERVKRAGTAIGQGVAVPHVRTLQVKTFVMAFARSREGLPFDAPDGEPVHLFFAMAAPPYDDRTYLKVYKSLAKTLLTPDVIEQLIAADDPDKILFILKGVD